LKKLAWRIFRQGRVQIWLRSSIDRNSIHCRSGGAVLFRLFYFVFAQPLRIAAIELRSVAFGRMTLHSIDRNGRRRKEITSGSVFHFRTHAIARQERLIDFSTANGHNRLHVYP